jgi:hypothetical protein
MRCTGLRSVEWRAGVVVGFALTSAAGVAAGCQSAEDTFAAILATACVQLVRYYGDNATVGGSCTNRTMQRKLGLPSAKSMGDSCWSGVHALHFTRKLRAGIRSSDRDP